MGPGGAQGLEVISGVQQVRREPDFRGVPAPFPKVLGEGLLGRAAIGANLALIRLSRALFSYQIFVVADCTPNVRFVLEDSRSRSERPHG